MKKYCLCGHVNEYSGMPPEKCEKCKKNFEFSPVITNFNQKKTIANIEELEDMEHFEDSEFDSLMQEEPEEISDDEMSRIFLADAHQGINLRDLIPKDKNKMSQSKPKTRKKK